REPRCGTATMPRTCEYSYLQTRKCARLLRGWQLRQAVLSSHPRLLPILLSMTAVERSELITRHLEPTNNSASNMAISNGANGTNGVKATNGVNGTSRKDSHTITD